MEDEILDTSVAQQESPNAEDITYSTYGSRLSAAIVDGIIVGGLSLVITFIDNFSNEVYPLTGGLQIAFLLFYYVYLVQASGATPGKRISGLKIVKLDGTDVGWTEAVLRYLPQFLIVLLSNLVTVAALSVADTGADGQSWWEKILVLSSQQEIEITRYVSIAWLLANTITLISTKNKRALHDIIAKTVVISTRE